MLATSMAQILVVVTHNEGGNRMISCKNHRVDGIKGNRYVFLRSAQGTGWRVCYDPLPSIRLLGNQFIQKSTAVGPSEQSFLWISAYPDAYSCRCKRTILVGDVVRETH